MITARRLLIDPRASPGLCDREWCVVLPECSCGTDVVSPTRLGGWSLGFVSRSTSVSRRFFFLKKGPRKSGFQAKALGVSCSVLSVGSFIITSKLELRCRVSSGEGPAWSFDRVCRVRAWNIRFQKPRFHGLSKRVSPLLVRTEVSSISGVIEHHTRHQSLCYQHATRVSGTLLCFFFCGKSMCRQPHYRKPLERK